MKTRNAALLIAMFAIPAISFADGGATEFLDNNTHVQADRAQVRADAVAAARTFSVNDGNIGQVEIAAAPKTREQVLAELAEANRLGLVRGGEQSIVPTIEQQIAITQAGLRALNGTPVAANASVAALIASPDAAQ